jgi:preprotein translocase subunit SecY
MVITGVRDGLLVLGLGLLVCFLGVSSFVLAQDYHISEIWLSFAWGSFGAVPAFLRAFRGHLNRPFMLPFLAVLAIIHGVIFMGLMKWRVPLLYWSPTFAVELSLGAWAAYRFYGIIPRGDI